MQLNLSESQELLRDTVGLTGIRVCCEQGICGACTILVDGQTARACLMLAVQADGADVVTVEGLGQPGTLHPLQQAFWDHHGLQCGYCTPGMLITAYELLTRNPDARIRGKTGDKQTCYCSLCCPTHFNVYSDNSNSPAGRAGRAGRARDRRPRP